MKRNTFKKALSALLCLMIVLSTLTVVSIGASAAEELPLAWDGSTATDWAAMKGTGTQADPYQIATPADYAAIVANMKVWAATENQYFKLTADLNFDGKLVGGIYNDGMAIKLDGDNHTIYNMHTAWGMFDTAHAGTHIQNLHFVGYQSGRAGHTAGLFQNNKGLTTIENVTFDKTSKIAVTNATERNGAYAAAFMCDVKADLVIKNCVNAAAIEAANFGGACIGYLRTASNITIENFVNYGSITVGSTTYVSNYNAGGLIGGMGPVAYKVTLKNCVNHGDVTAISMGSNGSIGGLIGQSDYAGAQAGVSTIDIINSYNTGKISGRMVDQGTAKYPTGYIAGIIGYLRFGGTATFDRVFNTGTLVVMNAASNAWVDPLTSSGTGPELTKYFTNIYATDAEHYTGRTAQTPAYGCSKSVHGITYDANVFKAYACCDLVAATDSAIKIATGAGADGVYGSEDDVTVNSTMAAEMAAIDAKLPAHRYSANCDGDCNVCGMTRTPGAHTFAHACSETCSACGAANTTATVHTYDNACDAACNVCSAERTPAEHAYDNACDADCNVCSAERTPAEHVYDNDCDTTCNTCSEARTIEHTSAGACDEKCDVCDAPLTPTGAHVWANDQDTDCDVCGATRTITPPVDEPTDDEPADETTAAPADDETTAAPETTEETVKADSTTKADDAADEGCASSVAGIGALLALTASFGFALVGKKKED